jgi:hypothetical protein
MDKAELEAKKNNLFHLLEYIIKRGENRFTIQCLVGHIKEHSAIFGAEHWSIEHHGSDNTSLLTAGPTKQQAYDSFRKLVKENKADVIYFVTKMKNKNQNAGNEKDKEIKIHVTKEKNTNKFTAKYNDFGNFTVELDTGAEEGVDSFLVVAESFLNQIQAFDLVKEMSVKSKNSKIGTLNVIKTDAGYSGYVSNSPYKPSGSYKTVEEFINKDVKPGMSKLNENSEITVEDDK